MNDLVRRDMSRKRVEYGRKSREKRMIIHEISLISIHRCISYDIRAIFVNMKYDGLITTKNSGFFDGKRPSDKLADMMMEKREK